jgi:hypothetical protein
VYKDGKLLYAESKEVVGSESTLHKYYFDGNNLATVLKAVVIQGDDKSAGGVNYQTIPVPAGKAAELISKSEMLKSDFSDVAPFKAKVIKNGEKYIATTCYDGKEFTLEDKNGYLGKTFKDLADCF